MFGAYQAGAWKALAGRFHPDIIVGASAGGINAWAIAGGASPDDLIALWRAPERRRLTAFRLFQPPWHGVFDSRPLHAFLRALCETYSPQMEIGIVATQVPGLRLRLFQGSEIGWRHLAASAAIPFGYRPMRIGGKLYVDGGLLGALPVWAAARMGATRIVAINALAYPPWRLAGWAIRAFRALVHHPPSIPPSVVVQTIQPERSLGTMREALFWRRDAIDRWIALGEQHAAHPSPPNALQ
jgi:NTE family protein